METSVTTQQSPSAFVVALWLTLASLGFNLLQLGLSWLLSINLSSTSMLSAFVPAIIVGYGLGYKHGVILSRKTRLQGLVLWLVLSLLLTLSLLLLGGATMAEVVATIDALGMMVMFVIAVLAMTILPAYFLFKYSEKQGIKLREKKQKSAS